MPKRNKTYPLSMDPEIYNAFRSIAKAQDLTMKEVLRVSLGLYIAHNVHALSIKKAGDTTPPAKKLTTKTRI